MSYEQTGDDPPNVLIVEDNTDLAELFSLWLRGSYTVKVANDCASAYEMLDETVDVALLDRQLPDGSGDELLTAIRAWELDCRVAMVTAIKPDVDVIEMGFDDYLRKPTTKEELGDTVKQLLAQAKYGEAIEESYVLASKMAMLETHCSGEELADNEEFAELEARFDELQQEIIAETEKFTDRQYRAEYTHLPARSD